MSAYDIDRNPFCIPDLSPMYEKVCEFVKEHQGEKGFICTDDPECDTIWMIYYSYEDWSVYEYEVKAVRIHEGNLQILFDSPSVNYTEESIMPVDQNEWYDVQYSEFVYFIPTIFNIAENIQEYVV